MQHKVKVFVKDERAVIPSYGSPESACFDFTYPGKELLRIHPGETVVVPTGLYLELPKWTELQIRSRSGKTVEGLVVGNAPGTIDCDYTGEIKIILNNNSNGVYTVEPLDKIAQGIVCDIKQTIFQEVKSMGDLRKTKRGSGGFGSTGK